MKYEVCLVIITVLSIIYNILLLFDKTYSENKVRKNNSINLKRWEKITTFIVMILILSILVFVLLKVKFLSYVFTFVYYITILSLYISILINILSKNEKEEISKSELSCLTVIPLIFTCLQSTKIWKNSIVLINNNLGENIVYFIFKESIKNFISIFFITIILFLIIIELKNIIHFKRKKQMKYLDFDEEYYVYSNSRDNKGWKFVKLYIKDILILIKNKILSIWQRVYMSTFIFVYKVFIKLIKRLTNNFSLYVIVIKTFSISIIATLLITYYKLLLLGEKNIIIDFYAVVITTIIIPIILNIISDLKNSNI